MAATRKPLRAVGDDETAPPTTPAKRMSVAEAAATGNHRALLVAMRERIATAVSSAECPPRDLAALTRRLQDVAKEIESIDLRAKEEGSDADDAAADEDWEAEAL